MSQSAQSPEQDTRYPKAVMWGLVILRVAVGWHFLYEGVTKLLEPNWTSAAYLAESNVMALEKVIDPREVYTRDVDWIRAADTLIAEVSVPSHGVGYEIGFALEQGKPVLCLAQTGVTVSKMITGNPNPGLQMKYYEDIEEGIAIIRQFLAGIICE